MSGGGPRGGIAWPSIAVLSLCVLAPTVGLLVWVLGNGRHRPVYLRSLWVRAGLSLLVLGALPLLASSAGRQADPHPLPRGMRAAR